jgi:hypothetical protein
VRYPRGLQLIVERPELVVQRGWHVLTGTRQRPILPADTHDWLLAGAVAWYAQHPADRAAIGTAAEHARLVAALTAAQQTMSLVSPDLGSAAPPRAAAKPRALRTALRLVYIAVAVAVMNAVANVVISVLLRENYLAAEAAAAANIPPPPPDEGAVLFDTNTWAFARGAAIVLLVGTVLLAVLAITLTRATSRGSDAARVSLVILSCVVGILAFCPCVGTSLSPTTEPAAGTFLNIWSGVQVLAGLGMLALAVTVLVLLLHADVAAYCRSSRDHASVPAP